MGAFYESPNDELQKMREAIIELANEVDRLNDELTKRDQLYKHQIESLYDFVNGRLGLMGREERIHYE